MLRSDEVG